MRLRTESLGAEGFLRRPIFSFSSFVLATMVGLISSFTFSAAYDMAHSALAREPQTISGVWQGRVDDVPAVTLKIEQKGDVVTGTARFSTIAATADGPEVIEESEELTFLNPSLEGNRLSFELRGRDQAHPAIFVLMELRFENEVEAELHCTSRQAEGAPESKDLPIKMKKERSF